MSWNDNSVVPIFRQSV